MANIIVNCPSCRRTNRLQAREVRVVTVTHPHATWRCHFCQHPAVKQVTQDQADRMQCAGAEVFGVPDPEHTGG